MVMYFSVSSLVHSFSFMVIMLREELSLTLLMMVKISSVRYGGLVTILDFFVEVGLPNKEEVEFFLATFSHLFSSQHG